MRKKRIAVLGCGMVGATMARDLAADEEFDVTVADLSPRHLERLGRTSNLRVVQADLSRTEELRKIASDCDVAVGALPSRFGFAALRTVIECGKPYADISFMPEDPLELDGFAKENGVTAVVDCGVSPGLSNMAVGDAVAQLDEAEEALILVGGLPKARRWPFFYKAPFAPSDVIEEYTRPARVVEGGRMVVKPALSEPELVDFPGIGTLEAFNTDGLRTLLQTVRVRNMREKTLRYPGHCELMRVFREIGLFGTKPLEAGGLMVRPLDLTAKLLFPQWTYEPGETEFTILRVVVKGSKDSRARSYSYELYDEFDPQTSTSSMARTTAFPCTLVARMLARGELSARGVVPPERLGSEPGVFERLLTGLAERKVMLRRAVTAA